MKISILQMKIQLGCTTANIDRMEKLFSQAMEQRPDVILLSELWSTGFYPRPIASYADPDGSSSRELLSKLAAKYQVNIVGGSVANSIGEHVFNTCYVFNRNGQLISTYHKTHLFSPSGEDEDFTAGDLLHVYELDGIRCATAICYDLRFPELIRRLALENISVLFLPAAWPIERLMHWQTLLRARAIENQIFLAAANGSGLLDNGFHLAGHSAIIDPWGEILTQADEEETILHANLKIAIRTQIRSFIDIFADRRPELYSLK